MGGFDDVVGDGVELIDFGDGLDLWDEAFEESEVPSCDASDGCDGLCVGEVDQFPGNSRVMPRATAGSTPSVIIESDRHDTQAERNPMRIRKFLTLIAATLLAAGVVMSGHGASASSLTSKPTVGIITVAAPQVQNRVMVAEAA